jgi:hypothetical protein
MHLPRLGAFALGALLLGASACLTITNTKTIVIKPDPGETKIVVTAKAKTHCQDYLLFEYCSLDVDLHEVK